LGFVLLPKFSARCLGGGFVALMLLHPIQAGAQFGDLDEEHVDPGVHRIVFGESLGGRHR
jgi:hypothetical protein